ncbi:PepSY domain-containing protein [Halalkalibacter krulwichiae]|uniref:Peptidase propeptide and YPEB domain protein n=1 Tax=Halalkalibacter krulwichiae TaxID=199441 RepID=A0A1X9MAE0_9BACI|nr:PepSY domain-containing protein [Halalkalibacter krulwichiae]ARK29133.1 Peptidase propeptide and YPEB domain protein [Halalkalibacter krulwichiae]
MKKIALITISLLLAGGAVIGVSAADNENEQVQEPTLVATYSINETGDVVGGDSQEEMITAERASEIALDFLGNGIVDEVELEKKQGRLVYEVDIDTEIEDGDIYVDAMTEEILYVDDDLMKMVNKAKSDDQKVAVITKESAGDIALNHIGEGVIDDIELESKHDLLYFEIEIELEDDRDVDVKVDAVTGEILTVTWDN